MRKTILKWVLLIGLIVYATTIAVWANHEASTKTIQSVDIVVDGNTSTTTVNMTHKGVEESLKAKYRGKLIGMPINAVNTREIEKYLSRLKNLESVQCLVTADRRLEVRVVPMIPEIRVFCGGKSWYVNKDGKAVETNAQFFSDVPVVEGNFRKGFQPKDILPLVRFIKNDSEMSNLVSMIVARDSKNLMLVPRINGHIINFGDTTRMTEKKRMLMSFYRKVMPYKGWQEYDTISVKFRNQIVATRRNKAILNHGTIIDEEIDPDEVTLADAYAVDSTRTNKTTTP